MHEALQDSQVADFVVTDTRAVVVLSVQVIEVLASGSLQPSMTDLGDEADLPDLLPLVVVAVTAPS